MSGLHDALAALLDRELAEHEEAAARSARADVRCLDCNLRYDEQKEYGCVIDGTAHSYDEDTLKEAAERARQEPREYVTLSVAEVRALLAEHPPADLHAVRSDLFGVANEIQSHRNDRPGRQRRRQWADRIYKALEEIPADLPVATGDAGTESAAAELRRLNEIGESRRDLISDEDWTWFCNHPLRRATGHPIGWSAALGPVADWLDSRATSDRLAAGR